MEKIENTIERLEKIAEKYPEGTVAYIEATMWIALYENALEAMNSLDYVEEFIAENK